ncbi:ecotin family protein [Thiothrix eikelboomii]|uniref:ecotin family protein n=1 Tax=Thiothrix eikelboomii TaxID=92487 RepID=UPI003BAF4761
MSALKLMSASFFVAATTAILPITQAASPPAVQPPGPVDMSVTMKPFPKPHPNDNRLVIRLPKRQNEASLLVRVTPGKHTQVDCNTQAYSGELETKTAQGWGYDFYVLRTDGKAMSTMMACPPNSSQMRFVPVASAQQTLTYNSRMPLVYYVPKGFTVNYEVFVPQQRGTAKPE